MASEAAVKRSLQSIGNMFSKGSWWVKDSLKMWTIQLQDIPDEALFKGVKACLRKAKKCPTVANLRSIIEADPSNQVGEPVLYKGCQACSNTGSREMARWYTEKGRQKVFFGLAACDCLKGRRLAVGAYEHWQDVVRMWEDSGSDEIFYTTHDHPVLTTEQRVTPEELQARKERAKAAEFKATGAWRHAVQK